MIIIGISGKKGAGKDAVCNVLLHHFKNSVRIAFADALKEEVAKACGRTVRFIEENKPNFRLILQGWGTDYRRKLCDENYWINEWLRKVYQTTATLVVVPDVRFQNEAAIIKELGGEVWRVFRKGLESDDTHASETDMDKFRYDTEIHNDQTLLRLEKEVIETLRLRQLLCTSHQTQTH